MVVIIRIISSRSVDLSFFIFFLCREIYDIECKVCVKCIVYNRYLISNSYYYDDDYYCYY